MECYYVIRKLLDCIFNRDGSQNRQTGDFGKHIERFFRTVAYTKHPKNCIVQICRLCILEEVKYAKNQLLNT